jgi:MFS transporter, SP family, sugar:H+ symporter
MGTYSPPSGITSCGSHPDRNEATGVCDSERAAPSPAGTERLQHGYYLSRVIQFVSVAARRLHLGFDTAVINGAVGAMRDDFGMGSALTGFVVSSALLGCLAGAFLAGRLADRWGRLRVMFLASALFTISALGSGFAFGPVDMIFWRVLGGLVVGAASVIAPA